MWDLSSPTRDPTRISCIGRRILYRWTPREVPMNFLKKRNYSSIIKFWNFCCRFLNTAFNFNFIFNSLLWKISIIQKSWKNFIKWTSVYLPPRFYHWYFTFLFFFGCAARHVELPWPGIEPMPPAVEAQSLNHWTTREILYFFFLNHKSVHIFIPLFVPQSILFFWCLSE